MRVEVADRRSELVLFATRQWALFLLRTAFVTFRSRGNPRALPPARQDTRTYCAAVGLSPDAITQDAPRLSRARSLCVTAHGNAPGSLKFSRITG